ncbi:MAG: protoheme farnesyltransferase [Actinomycetota bacterium]|nr:heme o synthase [Actinomycetota bacterium]
MPLNVRPVVPSRLFSHESKRSPKTLIGGYIALTKPRIIELLLVTTVPTMVLAAGKWPAWSLIGVTLLGGTLAAGGANTMNMYIDRDIDKLMKRTQQRPLVTGLIAPKNALVFAVILEIIAFAILWAGANLLSAFLALSATAFYVFIYSLWLKRTSKQNIVIGGAAGAVPTLVGWAAVTNSVGWPAVWLFIIIFLWTPPHFWALAIRHADEYRAANVPMLPAVVSIERTVRTMVGYTIVLAGATFVLMPVANLGWIYGVTAIVLGLGFTIGTAMLGHKPTEAWSMRVFSFSITYVTVLFGALMIDVLI